MKVNISIELDTSSPSDEKVLHSLMPILNGSVNSISTGSTPGKELPQSPGPVTPDKPARKRRTKAQIAADKAAEAKAAVEAEDEAVAKASENAANDGADIEAASNVAAEAKAAAEAAASEAKTDNLTGVTMDELREAVVSKLGKHTKAIKDKLEAFGAAKVTQLKPEQYNEFLIFVKKLK